MNSVVSKLGSAFATKLVAEHGHKIKFMYRESTDRTGDSGWHFFAGEESQEYVDDPENTGVYTVSAIVELDPLIVPLLETLAPCAFERDDEGSEFVESDFDYWPEE